MEIRLFTNSAVRLLLAAGAASGLGIAHAQIVAVAAGTDYLQTGPGTHAKLLIGGKTVTVKLRGAPIAGLGSADTVIEKVRNAVFDRGGPAAQTVAVPITLAALNLQGSVPGPNGGACTVSVKLAPTPASTGLLHLTATSATGGTYTSTLLVNVMITFTPAVAGDTCYPPILNAQCAMKQENGTWQTTPLAGEQLVVGPYGDLAANQHTSLPPGYVDFYISALQTDSAATAEHATCEAFAATGTACPQ